MSQSIQKFDITISPTALAAYGNAVEAFENAMADILGMKSRRYRGNDLEREASIALKMREADDTRRSALVVKPPRRAVPHPHEGRSERAMPRSNRL